jgi:hypothetical protein
MLRPYGALRRILEGTRLIRAKTEKRSRKFFDTSGHPDSSFSDRKKKRGGATCKFTIIEKEESEERDKLVDESRANDL